MEGEEKVLSSGPKISIIDTDIKSDKLRKHVLYSISGSDNIGSFACLRRYKEFSTLRYVLITHFPGCYIPQIPPKQMIGNLASDFVHVRRTLLEYFLQQTSLSETLYQSEPFQTFIRGPPDFLKPAFEMKYVKYSSIAQALLKEFSDYGTFQVSQENESHIEDSCQYFKTGLEALEKFESNCKENLENYNELKKEVKNLMSGVKEISLFYSEKYGGTAVDVIEQEEFQNPYIELLNWTRQDILDLQAMVECIQNRQNLSKIKVKSEERLEAFRGKLVKAQSGKKSIGDIFSKKSKESKILEIEGEIKKSEEEIESLSLIFNVTTARLVNDLISEFKEFKTQRFENMMKAFTECSVKEYSDFINQAKHLESKLNN